MPPPPVSPSPGFFITGRERGNARGEFMHYKKKLFARELRREATNEEKKVWKILRGRGFLNLKFRRQHELEGFIVDFYCHDLRLAIEIDGKVHDKQKDYDRIRQALIQDKGITIIRVTNEEINKEANILLERIEEFISPPSPIINL